MNTSVEDRACAELSCIRFHQTFYLPPDLSRNRHKRFRVTYSDSGRSAAGTSDEEANQPTVLFCGGLMGGRWVATMSDALAKEKGVRVICIDRPGVGGTDAVSIEERLAVWLEIIPALLAHLFVRHVALASHSGGSIYAVNFLLKYRNLLHPRYPYVSFFSPWVHQSHTDATVLAVTDFLPRAWVGNFHGVAQFVSKYVAPSFGFSSGIISKFLPSDDKPVIDMSTPDDTEDEKKLAQKKEDLTMKYVFAEELSGVSDDALIFLKRTTSPNPWGSWGDFDNGLRLVTEQEAARLREPDVAALKVDVFYGETDMMTGTTGCKWFDACWADARKGKEGVVNYESRVCEGTNHDNVLDKKFGVIGPWLDTVAASFRESGRAGDTAEFI